MDSVANLRVSTNRLFTRNRTTKDDNYGKRAEVKTFYENTLDDNSAQRWVEWAPPAVPQQRRVKWAGYAIQVFKTKREYQEFGDKFEFAISHIRLLSPYLRDELKDILKAHDVEFESDSATIYWPLQPLYFARHKIAELRLTTTESTQDHLGLLNDFIETELASVLDSTEELENENQITHTLVWTLFPKGTLIVAESEAMYRGYRVVKSKYLEDYSHSFSVDCEYIRFDGVRYGYMYQTLNIRYFEGKKDITALEIYPLQAAAPDIRDRLARNGHATLEFQGIHYSRYLNTTGATNKVTKDGGSADMWGDNVHARVMIDFFHYGNRVQRSIIQPLPGYLIRENKAVARERRRGGYDTDIFSPGEMPDHGLEQRRRPVPEEQQRNKDILLQNDEHILIIDPNLDGFSLISKSWRTFSVERISKLDLNSDAFDHLVHPDRNKDLVCSVVEDHKNYASSQDDVIAGKGQGLLILLSGPPGTGKTLMAEAIADKTHSPLYYVDARDLGTSSDMDGKLLNIMADAAEWNALLLLDEADVYLQERSGTSLERNEIVSIFLRRLEYYKGTMFLTTNLWETIDPAMESRIQVHLQFPRLPSTSRAKIWENFLKRIPKEICDLNDSEVQKLGLWNLNGRDIKNALKMTAAWCRQNDKDSYMTFRRFEDVITITCPRATKDVEHKINGVNGAKEDSPLKNGVVSNFVTESHTGDMIDLL